LNSIYLKSSFWLSLSVLCLGLLLLTLSIPRFISSLDLSYINTVISEMQQGKPFSPDVVSRVEKKINDSSEWHSGMENQFLKSIFLYEQLKIAAKNGADISVLVNDVDIATKGSLFLNPIDPFSWYQLAFVRYAQGQSDNMVLAALRYSIYTGRVEKVLLKSRLLFLSDYLEVMDDGFIALTKSQLRLLWEMGRWDLIKLVVQKPKLERWVLDVLYDSPDDKAFFKDRLERAVKKQR